MADYIVAVDAGNGFTNAVRHKGKSYDSIGFPSVRAVVSGDNLGLGSQFEMQFDYVQWGGFRYVVGDDVFISNKAVERHQGAFRYGDEFWLFLVSTALGKLLPKKGGSVDLTVFAPPSMFFDAKEGISERLKKIKNAVSIQFKGDSKPRIFTIEQLTVHPEGLGAVASFALDDKGQAVQSDILEGTTVVLDMGMYTLDALQIVDGQFNPESLQSATWEGQGIRAHVLERLLPKIKKASSDFALMTTDDMDFALRRSIQTDNYELQSGSASINIEAAIKKYTERYADYIANTILDGVFNSLRGIRHVILVGGGAVLVSEYLQKYYPDKVLSVADYEHVANIPAIEMNAVGGLRLALARQTA